MPGSNCTCNTCVGTDSIRRRHRTSQKPPEPPTTSPWSDQNTEGPQDLYAIFATSAVWEFLGDDINRFSDREIDLLFDAVQLGVSVALNAAGVNHSWRQDYDAATAHLRQPKK